jgi:hypothetical protein
MGCGHMEDAQTEREALERMNKTLKRLHAMPAKAKKDASRKRESAHGDDRRPRKGRKG